MAHEEERLDVLEAHVAQHGKTIEELSSIITEQWQIIERLQRRLDTLTSRFVSLEEQGGPAPESTKPPHW
jgi:SlyX protein